MIFDIAPGEFLMELLILSKITAIKEFSYSRLQNINCVRIFNNVKKLKT